MSENPFIYKQEIKQEDKFFDRESELSEAEKKINKKNLLIIGSDGIGKSSLMLALNRRLQKKGISLYVCLKEEKGKFLQEILLEEFKKLKKITYTKYANIYEEIKKQKEVVFFLIDDLEFSSVEDIEFLKRLKELENVKICLSMSFKTYWEGRFKDLYEEFEIIKLQLFTQEAAKELIYQYCQNTTISFSKEDIDFILQLSDGHPFYLQLLCWHLFEFKKRKENLNEKDYHYLKTHFATYANPYFFRLWEGFSKERRCALFKLVELKPTDIEILKSLRDEGLLKIDGSFFSNSFREFVRNRLLEEEERFLEISFKGEMKKTDDILLPEDKIEVFNTARVLVKSAELRDKYTIGHSDRVAMLAEKVAIELGLDEPKINILKMAALLHDIGKIGISEVILLKPQPLTKEEFDIIKQHPIIGYNILEALKFPYEVSIAVRHHHERINGSGYPFGLASYAIPEFSRIISVCDAFDAMLSDRAYRPLKPLQMAIQELQDSADIWWDGRVVLVLLKLIRERGEELLKCYTIL